ncbi:hypothetical protein [Methylovirgula sp. HY1]|uniref:hypothetical protein n=1 Tax=Methylovirgula sp. HY1 TaxID=2822761 RepID=UPI001C792D51|nr:hypothetical protein [Methylovirgula sp. HY1]QXX76441.1 hypothetical protein MHY1_03284 [Methylovirgula sp. HY1]
MVHKSQEKTSLSALTKEDFPPNFRRIRLELAREKNHPVGSASSGYIVIAPLDATAHLDSAAWRENRELCRVVRFRPEEADDIGHLIRRPGGSWAFHYDIEGTIDDEAGHRLNTESFITGEYISIMEEHGPRTFQVASVERI